MSDEDYAARFGGIGRLYGPQAMARLQGAHVAVIGIGGVGSWSVEALARSGVGRLTLIDLDDVCVTNTNRQLHALEGNVGRSKVAAMAERAQRINPQCALDPIEDFFAPDNADALLDRGYDAVIDAIDHVDHKTLLVARCAERGLPLVVVGGAGGRRDPSALRIDDLTRSVNDGLLRRLRKRLRQRWGFPRGERRWGITCVYSQEHARYPGADGQLCERPDPSVSLKLDCASGFGTASFVTGAFGLMAASVVVSGIADGSIAPSKVRPRLDPTAADAATQTPSA